MTIEPRRSGWKLAVAGVLVTLMIVTMFINAIAGARRVQYLEDRDSEKDRVHAAERHAAAKERAAILAGQRELERKNARLAELLEASGIDVPASLLTTRTTTRTIERDSDDDGDDDDGDTIIVQRPSASPPASDNDDDEPPSNQLEIPEVPLPDLAGEATDNVKRMVPLP